MRRAVGKPTQPPAAIGKNNRPPGIRQDEERRLPFFRLRPAPKHWQLAVQHDCEAVISKVENNMVVSIFHEQSHKCYVRVRPPIPSMK
jgi:hypothetical protein